MFGTSFWISLLGSGVQLVTTIVTIKLANMAIVPKTSGEMPNKQSALLPAPNQPHLNFTI